MRNLIKSILKEEYEREPQVGDLLLCHTVTSSFNDYLTKNKTYKVIDRKFYTGNVEVVTIEDDSGMHRMFTIKPVEGSSYKTWFHLLDNVDFDDAFESFNESEEDDFGWAEDIIDSPNLMVGDKLQTYLNSYFKTHKSPRFGREYWVYRDSSRFRIEDETGPYTITLGTQFNLDKIKKQLESAIGRVADDISLLEEYQDLYDTMLPLFGNRIVESEEDFDWVEDVIGDKNIMNSSIAKFLNDNFEGFSDAHYSWANFNCGMGECCDMYAVGFVLPSAHYDDYLFKLVDGENYREFGEYDDYPDGLPEPCYEQPNINDPAFDTILISEEMYEEMEDHIGLNDNWKSDLLIILNKIFKINAKKIKLEYEE